VRIWATICARSDSANGNSRTAVFDKTDKMADLEAVLADVSYLMAMEKSKSAPAARASKKIVLPDPRYVFLARSFPDIDLTFR